jgi:hypothetical protein
MPWALNQFSGADMVGLRRWLTMSRFHELQGRPAAPRLSCQCGLRSLLGCTLYVRRPSEYDWHESGVCVALSPGYRSRQSKSLGTLSADIEQISLTIGSSI